MTHPLSNEMVQVQNLIGEQVTHLNPPDLKILPFALRAERERICREIDETLLKMRQQRSEAVAHFTQLLLCARQDLPLVPTNYFDTIDPVRRLSHE